MAEAVDVTVKPVKSFVIRPVGDKRSSALIFETVEGRSGYRVANGDIGRLVALIIGEMAKLPDDQIPQQDDTAAPLRLRGVGVREAAGETDVALTLDFGGTKLQTEVDRNLLATALTEFLKIAQKV